MIIWSMWWSNSREVQSQNICFIVSNTH